MSLGDWLVGSGQTQAQANANYASEQAQYQAALTARQNAGNITPDQVAAYDATVGTPLEDQNAGALQAAVQPYSNVWSDLSAIPGNLLGSGAGNLGALAWVGLAGLAFFFVPGKWKWAAVGLALFLAYESMSAANASAAAALGNFGSVGADAGSIFSYQPVSP